MRRRRKNGHIPRLAQHLVNLALVQFLGVDHVARIFLQHHGLALYFLEQVAVKLQRRRFMLQRLAQDIADIVFVGFQHGPMPSDG